MAEVSGFIDFSQPVGLIMNAVIHHMLDEEDPYGFWTATRTRSPPAATCR